MEGSAREVMFVTIHLENICLTKDEINKAVKILPNSPMFAVRL
jgi:hypothetical protein